MTDSTFVIGDVHGHIDRLNALLDKAIPTKRSDMCVIQLGDLGHHSASTRGDDRDCWLAAEAGLVDRVVWGNHDRAVVDRNHWFGGSEPYAEPFPEVRATIKRMKASGRLVMAQEACGWLITHAGLHAAFEFQLGTETLDKRDPAAIAAWINEVEPKGPHPVIDAIGYDRGGPARFGGILWRDISEDLFAGVPQIFGHSASAEHEARGELDKWHCIDIGGEPAPLRPDQDCLMGIWLPSQEIVRVDAHELGHFSFSNPQE
jgi:hypothetical protein